MQSNYLRVYDTDDTIDDEGLRAIIDNAPFGAHEYELHSDGRLIFVGFNPAANRILKTDCAQFLGKSIEEAFPPLTRTKIPEIYRSVAKTKKRYEIEQVAYEYNQISGVYEISAFPTSENHMAVFFRDITERKKAEDLLRIKTEELEKFFTLSLELICIIGKDGRFTKVNPMWERILGYSLDELKEHEIIDFVHPEDLSRTSQAIADLRKGESLTYFTNRYRCSDQSYRWLEWKATTSGPLIYAVAHDVTDRITTEKKLLYAKEAAESASRIKSEFIDIAAHELKTPLTPIKILVDGALYKLRKGEAVPTVFFDHLERQTKRLTSLVEDILNVSRLETGRLVLHVVRSDLALIVREAVEGFRRATPSRQIVLKGLGEPVFLDVDPVRIRQLLSNLLDNALNYSPPDTPVEVEVSRQANMIRVSVTDHGPGIPQDKQAALFTQFSRIDSDATLRHPGLGLGLYTSRRIAELHGGQIGVRSKLGHGSTFYFDLPRKEH